MALKDTETSEISIPLPQSLDSRIHIRTIVQAKALSVFVTVKSQDEPSGTPPMGSFVYGLPNKFDASQPLSTVLFTHEPTLEFTTRLAKILARKACKPVYVANSMSFERTGMGGTVEEEMEAFKNIVEFSLQRFQASNTVPVMVNGQSTNIGMDVMHPVSNLFRAMYDRLQALETIPSSQATIPKG